MFEGLKQHLDSHKTLEPSKTLLRQAEATWGPQFSEDGSTAWWTYLENEIQVVVTDGSRHFIENGYGFFNELEKLEDGTTAAVGYAVRDFNEPRELGHRQVLWD